MARIVDHKQLYFPVELQPIYTITEDGFKRIKVPGKLAVVNSNDGNVISVVSKEYRLVSNEEAVKFARHCAEVVFEGTHESEWEVFAADAPKSQGHCHLDLRHRTGNLDFNYVMVGKREVVPEAYGPYIRVTNSYNTTRALTFTIGCYRKICENGVTDPETVITFSFPHTNSNIKEKINFRVDQRRVRQMQQKFTEAFDSLRKFKIDRDLGAKLVHYILAIKQPDLNEDDKRMSTISRQRDWYKLESHIKTRYDTYAKSLGDTAYSALQAATELASNSFSSRFLYRDKASMQLLAGEWMLAFREDCKNPSFDIHGYLEGKPTHVERAKSRHRWS